MSRTDGWAIAALLLVVAVAFAPALFGNDAAFTWNVDRWEPWSADASPADLARPTRLADCARQFYVMRELASEAIHEGRLPLWNRWIYAGTPFLANFQPAVFYPPNLLLLASPLDTADQMTAFMVLHYLIATIGAYVLLRSFGARPAAALLGAFVFGACGHHAARTGNPTLVATGSWIPWSLAAARRWFVRTDRRAFLGMVGALTMSGLAGFPQAFVFHGYAFGIFGLVHGFGRGPGAFRRWFGWGLAGVLGIGLLAIQLFPTLEFMKLAQDSKNTPDMLASGTLHPWAFGKLVIPDLLGRPTDDTNAAFALEVGSGYYHQTERSTSVYLGVLPLLLAASVLLAPGDRRRATAAAALIALFGCALCLPGPTSALLTKLPGLGFSRPDRATLLASLGLALLAGLGADRLAGREGPGATRPANGLAFLVGGLALAFAIAILAAGDRLLPARVAAIAADAIRPGALAALALATGALLLVAARASGRLPGAVFLALALALVAADLGPFFQSLNVMQPKSRIFPAAPAGGALDWLQQRRLEDGPFRIFHWERTNGQFTGALPPSTGAIYGVEDALGFDSLNLARLTELMDAIDPAIVVRRGNFRGPADPRSLDTPLLDLLDVRFVAATRADAAGPGPWPAGEPVRVPGLALWERPSRGRVFLVDEVRVRSDPRQILAEMAESSFRPDLVAYSEVPVPGVPPAPAAAGDARSPRTDGGAAPAGIARLAEHEDERVVVEVDAERAGLLVLADAYYPGWKASVDGEERPIHRVDHLFRGVAVRPGDRRVEFTYDPDSLRHGAGVTLAAALLTVLATFLVPRRRPASLPEVS
ncbi:MAG: YfhO family protein [bacterium]